MYQTAGLILSQSLAQLKVVKVVIPKLYELELLQPYQVSGYGYDIRNAGMVFIDSEES